MSAPCPKCGYIRQLGETAPDYECPKCGVVYAKYLDALHKKAAAADQATTNTAQPPGLSHTKSKLPRRKVAGGIFAALFALWVVGHLGDDPPAGMLTEDVAPALKPAPPPRPAGGSAGSPRSGRAGCRCRPLTGSGKNLNPLAPSASLR